MQGTMVMVNKGGGGGSSQAQTDPELARLERIPSFLPIMRATLSGAAGSANKASVLENHCNLRNVYLLSASGRLSRASAPEGPVTHAGF